MRIHNDIIVVTTSNIIVVTTSNIARRTTTATITGELLKNINIDTCKMDIKSKRIIGFFFCVVVRSLIIWWSSLLSRDSKSSIEETRNSELQWKLLGSLTTFIGLGLLGSYLLRKYGYWKKVGFGGNKVYWYSLLHSFFYLLFSFLWFFKVENSYAVLIVDLLIGVLTFTNHYFL
jgi:hypothetical protein